jgi:hypothetical protein
MESGTPLDNDFPAGTPSETSKTVYDTHQLCIHSYRWHSPPAAGNFTEALPPDKNPL